MKINPIKVILSLGKSDRCGKVICIAVNGKSIQMFFSSNEKTSPFCKRVFNDGNTLHTLHAEMEMLSKLKNQNLKKMTFYVIRINRHDAIAMARPCRFCRDKLRDSGIKSNQIIYSNWSGDLTKERNLLG